MRPANPKWSLPANIRTMSSADKDTAMNNALQHDYAMLLVDSPNPSGAMPYALDWKGKADMTFAVRVGYPSAILDAAIVQQVPGYVFFTSTIPVLTAKWPMKSCNGGRASMRHRE